MPKIFTSQTILRFSFAVVFAATLVVTPAVGRSSTGGVQAQDKMTAQTVTINGKVKAVSESTLTVVDDQNSERTVTLAAETKITKGGKVATAADIKADDAVVVVATKSEGDVLTATAVKVS